MKRAATGAPLDPPPERPQPAAPVRLIPGDEDRGAPEEGIGLCLSGGGYRAMLFHLGALWRLHELEYLGRVTRVSSVSGGSITAAVLGLAWKGLRLDAGGSIADFKRLVVEPITRLAGRTIDLPAVLVGGLVPGTNVGDRVARAYRDTFEGKTLQDLPAAGEGPLFVINATNLQSGVLWRFSRPYARDYRVGKIQSPEFPLAQAVAASSAFPPVLCPVRLELDESSYEPGTGDDLQRAPFTTRPTLGDGGIYDNLGLENAWKTCKTVLVSDGGGAMAADCGRLGPFASWRWRDWGSQSVRVLKVIDNQVRSLRKRQAIAGFKAEAGSEEHRAGTYWGIHSDIPDYRLPSALPVPKEESAALAAVPTRLKQLDVPTQQRLVNWGYAICDAAMRKWVVGPAAGDPSYPYPDNALGGASGGRP